MRRKQEHDFGTELRLRREALGWSQKDVSQGMGVTFQAISKQDGKFHISADRLVRYATLMNVHPLYFYGDHNAKTLVAQPYKHEERALFKAFGAAGEEVGKTIRAKMIDMASATLRKELGRSLRTIRRKKKLDLVEVGIVVKMKFQNISKIEKGQSLDADNVAVFADALDVKIGEILRDAYTAHMPAPSSAAGVSVAERGFIMDYRFMTGEQQAELREALRPDATPETRALFLTLKA